MLPDPYFQFNNYPSWSQLQNMNNQPFEISLGHKTGGGIHMGPNNHIPCLMPTTLHLHHIKCPILCSLKCLLHNWMHHKFKINHFSCPQHKIHKDIHRFPCNWCRIQTSIKQVPLSIVLIFNTCINVFMIFSQVRWNLRLYDLILKTFLSLQDKPVAIGIHFLLLLCISLLEIFLSLQDKPATTGINFLIALILFHRKNFISF